MIFHQFINKGDSTMTITLLDLYNTAATQEWSMYDNDASNTAEFEQSLLLALNKAAAEIIYSYPFSFRERTHIIFTVPNINNYDLPAGLIKTNPDGKYAIKLNSKFLEYKENYYDDNKLKNLQTSFENDRILFAKENLEIEI